MSSMRSERRQRKGVASSCGRQRNIGNLQRSVSVWHEMPMPSATEKFWRKWPKPGASSPRMMSEDALNGHARRSDLRRGCARDFVRRPDDSTPAPFSSGWPELAGRSWCSPAPSTLWRSAGTRVRSACRGSPPIDANLSQLVIRQTVPGTVGGSCYFRWQPSTTGETIACSAQYGTTAARRCGGGSAVKTSTDCRIAPRRFHPALFPAEVLVDEIGDLGECFVQLRYLRAQRVELTPRSGTAGRSRSDRRTPAAPRRSRPRARARTRPRRSPGSRSW